jgi:outer membrane translocation and assembly module TamA
VLIALAGLSLAVLALLACGSQRTFVLGDGYRLRDVRFEGVRSLSKKRLLDHLFAGETSWVPFTPNYPHDEALVQVDARRVQELYRSYGFHQARVTGVEERVDGRKVDLVIRVDEGQPTVLRTVSFAWPPECALPREQQAVVEREATWTPGAPFAVAWLNAGLGSLRQDLLVRGFPLARVTSDASVDLTARVADVVFRLEPGPYARIGAVEVEGLVDVPRDRVDVETRFALGAPYSPARVAQLEEALKAMRVFQWVATLPPDRVQDGQLTLRVRVSEAQPERIRVGGQLTLETIRWQEQASIEYTHSNLFRRLWRLEVNAVAGWAEMPNPWAPALHGPVASLTPRLLKKGLLEDHLEWELAPTFEVNLQEGYQYYSPGGRLGVSRWFGGVLKLSLSHNLQFVDFYNLSPLLDAKESILGRDFRDPFLLSFLEAGANLYLANSILKPTDGMVLSATYDLAGSFLGSRFDFHKILAGVKAYWKPWRRLQLASRLQTGLILPFGANPGAPLSSKFYLGGASTVRGWASRRLSPRIEECTDADGCETVPIGGYTMVEGNLEARLRTVGPLFLVAFADMGDVQALEHTYKPGEWSYTAGPGLRAETPLGLVRLDVGFRLNDPGVYRGEKGWGLYFGFGEAF